MKEITYLGPSHILKVDGQEIRRGEKGIVSDEIAESLKDHPKINIQVTDARASDPAKSTAKASTVTATEPKEEE